MPGWVRSGGASAGGPLVEGRLKLWLEHDGGMAFSEYRVGLLEAVRDTGSLSHAAGRLGLSYRRAWGKIKELEQTLGLTLVASETGGAGGGHTSLTPAGEELVLRFREFQRRMDEALRREFTAAFAGYPACRGAAPAEPAASPPAVVQ